MFTPAMADWVTRLPDGTTLELVTGGGSPYEPDPNAPGSQRFAGTLREGSWQVERVWPAVSRDALAQALALAQEHRSAQGFVARDEEEARSILDAVSRHPDFATRKLRLSEGRLWCDDEQRDTLGRLVFRHRLGDQWPMKWDEDEEPDDDEDGQLELDEALSQFLGWEPTPSSAPHHGEVVLDGRGSRFFRADLTDLPSLDREALSAAERGMEAVGFSTLGDLVLEQLDRLVLRAFAATTGDTYALHVQTVAGDAQSELITWFADGSILTTTTNGNGRSFPQERMHVRSYPGLEVESLYRKHRAKVGIFAEAMRTTAVPFEPTLESVARAIDEYLVRRSRC
jgi:hypothetical protein